MLTEFGPGQIFLVSLIFLWTGFVRTGLGFGGAALGLPLLLFIDNQPIVWLPVIGAHLLFFSGLTLRTRLNNVDWTCLKRSALYIIPSALVGVLGLLNLPNDWLVIFIYSVTAFYAVTWILNFTLHSSRPWIDRLLLILGGYIAGTSLSGAPLIVAVYMRNVAISQLRNTLFVLWFILVSIKMSAFALLSVDLHFYSALMLLPVAAIGHVIGLKVHNLILKNDLLFKRITGVALLVICLFGFASL